MATVPQRTANELKAAIDTMFRIRAVESPPDEQGARTIWHRGAKGADLVTTVDKDGKVARQELYLFEHYFLFDRQGGLRTGVNLEKVGSSAARASGDIAFDQDAQLGKKRLEDAAQALSPYSGADKLIGHAKRVFTSAATGGSYSSDEPMTRNQDALKLEDLKAASQELQRRELDARLSQQRRNLLLAIGAVLLAAGSVLTYLLLK
ncbi:MAG: hypothetical protein JNK82_23415 [Myxococcaceae bacterium]|nr:hypothetical protein [Myxococcaceae bacterium]